MFTRYYRLNWQLAFLQLLEMIFLEIMQYQVLIVLFLYPVQ